LAQACCIALKLIASAIVTAEAAMAANELAQDSFQVPDLKSRHWENTSARPLSEQHIAKVVEAGPSKKHDIEERYLFKSFFGVSGHSKMHVAVRQSDGKDVVVKLPFNATCLPGDFLRREFDILKRIHHPYIVQALELVVDGPDLALVTEYVPGCSLHQFMIFSSEDGLQESVAQPLAKKLFKGIEYLHSKNICHQAIDPKNVWMTHDNRSLKLTDFCKARWFDASSPTGTTEDSHVASDSSLEQLAQAFDVWGGGICLYFMLFGHVPETCSKGASSAEPSKCEHLNVPANTQRTVSPAGIEFMTQSLTLECSKRPAAAQLLQFEWMQLQEHEH